MHAMACMVRTAKFRSRSIEDLFLNPAVKKAIILLLYHNDIKVLKDALAYLGQYQTLISLWYSDPGGKNTVFRPPKYKFKKSPYKQVLYVDSP
jgi:hypothetical protein